MNAERISCFHRQGHCWPVRVAAGERHACWKRHCLAEGWLLGFSDVTALLCSRWARGLGGGIHDPTHTLASEPSGARND